jgi:hypothetical protein
MSNEVVDERTDPTTGENVDVEEQTPRQTVRRMAADNEVEVGPFFPSGMNSVEAAWAGATGNMSEEDVARLHGEVPATADPDTVEAES